LITVRNIVIQKSSGLIVMPQSLPEHNRSAWAEREVVKPLTWRGVTAVGGTGAHVPENIEAVLKKG
jgi:hypothetical protein